MSLWVSHKIVGTQLLKILNKLLIWMIYTLGLQIIWIVMLKMTKIKKSAIEALRDELEVIIQEHKAAASTKTKDAA